MGILCPYHYFGCFDNVDYSRIRIEGKSFKVRDLEKALIVPERDRAIINKWIEKAENKPTIAFCCSHRHAERVAKSFRNAGINAESYLSKTTSEKRLEIRDNLQTGKVKVICTVDIFNEGIDIPFAECLLFLRPTESKRIFFQQLGRGLRHSVGKDHCTVIDFIGNFKNAFKIVEYQTLDNEGPEEDAVVSRFLQNPKDVFNLPDGCKVEFEEKVIDLFGQISNDPRFASRQNIGKILIYQYERLRNDLGRKPTKQDIDRNCLLGRDLYKLVFGSWKNFELIIEK